MPGASASESMPVLGKDRLRRVIDSALDGMIVIDSSGTVLLYNAACERLFGYTEQEVLGSNVKRLMTPPDRENHDSYLRNYLRSGEAKVIGIGRDVTGRRKDGSTVPIRLSVGELRDHDNAPLFIGTLHDLTESLRARERLEELRSELRQVARASAVGEMGAALAHELTQPLSAVAGFVEASVALIDQGDAEVPARVREYMDQAVAPDPADGHRRSAAARVHGQGRRRAIGRGHQSGCRGDLRIGDAGHDDGRRRPEAEPRRRSPQSPHQPRPDPAGRPEPGAQQHGCPERLRDSHRHGCDGAERQHGRSRRQRLRSRGCPRKSGNESSNRSCRPSPTASASV